MPSLSTVYLLALLITHASPLTLPSPHHPTKRSPTSPFTRLIAFGDELTDNGNGSYAHNITGAGSTNYGFGTWTDGPVAVSYLADLLGLPLTDYAFGSSDGGSTIGATINNTYTPSTSLYNGQPVQSVHDQVFWNYSLHGAPGDISTSLQFLWAGQNDLIAHTDAYWEGDPRNEWFAGNISDRIRYNAEHLLALGAPYVFVPNIYPKHLAPVSWTYICNRPESSAECTTTWGNVISAANTAIESALAKSKYAKQLIYYDVFGFMVDLMNNKDSYSITQPLDWYCDGDPAVAHWDYCASGDYVWEGATHVYWMTFVEPTTTVHKLIAQDMKKRIDETLEG